MDFRCNPDNNVDESIMRMNNEFRSKSMVKMGH